MIAAMLLCNSCRDGNEKPGPAGKPGKAEMEEMNRFLIRKDREVIQNYIERKQLTMSESPTGLWYMITKQGEGKRLTDNDRISMSFECFLLDGTLCYSSSELGPKEIILGKSELEPGLLEGLKLLRHGSEAVFILPPFLAYGLVGDGKKIPPRTTIVYKVNIE